MEWNESTSNKVEDFDKIINFEGTETFEKFYGKELETTSTSDKNHSFSWTKDFTNKIKKSKLETLLSVFDVAQYILNKIGPMTTMKLQKLVYYCQAWSLVWDEAVLFPESIEAWANGPVVKKLFDYHRGMFHISAIPVGNPDILKEHQRETIDAVLDYYGKKSSQWLIDLTNNELPWKNARAGMNISERGNRKIKLDEMAEYYSSLQAE